MELKKRGRKKIEDKLKVKPVAAYIKTEEVEAIEQKYGSVTKAVRKEILSKLK